MPSFADLRRRPARKGASRKVAEAVGPGLFDAAPEGKPAVRMRVVAAVPETPAARIWSVGELVRNVRGLVERSFAQIVVEGEISNWRPAASGHCYFTLKDGEAQLSIVLFRRQAQLVRFVPKDGDAVRIRGSLSIYESRGQMQLVAESMEPVGLGALLAATQALKERLRREGLFENKRPLPPFPECVGVVTSLHGAALRDILKVVRRRHAGVHLVVYPAAVQGPNCAAEVAAGVRWFSARAGRPGSVDVVVVARGGGSWEDLHGFDDERVARAIAACAVPVITGIGHATDSVIADAAADVCAPTPSAAAELVTAAQFGIVGRVAALQARLGRAGRFELMRQRQRFSGLNAEMALRRVRADVDQRAQHVDDLRQQAGACIQGALHLLHDRVGRLEARLRHQHPALTVARRQRHLQQLRMLGGAAAARNLAAANARLEHCSARLQALSPLKVLERGYALVYLGNEQGGLLRDAKDAPKDTEIVARLAQGRVRARVEETET